MSICSANRRGLSEENLDMLLPKISMVLESGEFQPTIVAECVERAVNAEFCLKQIKKERKQFFETKKNEKNDIKGSNQGNNQQNQNNNKRKRNFSDQKNPNNGQQSKNLKTYPQCSKCNKYHVGECRIGNNKCFVCGGDGHKASSYPNNQGQVSQQKSQNAN